MKLLIFLNLTIIYIHLSLGAVHLGFSEDPDHPGYCLDRVHGLGLIAPGQTINDPEKCVEISCHTGSFIESYSCGVYGDHEGCVLSDPIIAPYPQCCHRHYICKDAK